MANSSTTVRIAPLKDDNAPLWVPHLMPFHIAHSGPAPISTYFRVKSAPEPTFGRDAKSPPAPAPAPLLSANSAELSDSQTTLVELPSTSTPGSSASVATLNSTSFVMDVTDVPMGSDTPEDALSGPSHLVASFRGREMRGTKVDLPDGYMGIVLRVPEHKKENGGASAAKVREEEKPKAKAKGRATRRSKRVQEVIEVQDEDDAMDGGESGGIGVPEGPVRVLQPVSTFPSFVLWHPDNPVDEGRDEYMRSLKEWTRLAAEIHRVED